jgi:hypothetical protein
MIRPNAISVPNDLLCLLFLEKTSNASVFCHNVGCLLSVLCGAVLIAAKATADISLGACLFTELLP